MPTFISRFLTISLLIASQQSIAENNPQFDCSVIYDEYDSLMYNQYLKSPESYVDGLITLLNQTMYTEHQSGKLKLKDENSGKVIAIFKTNQNLYGKMIFSFTKHASREQIKDENQNPDALNTLTIDNITIFQSVNSGYAPTEFGPITLRKDYSFDIDGFGFFSMVETNPEKNDNEQKRSDFSIVDINDEIGIQAINDAKLFFPTQSLCAKEA